MEEGKLLRGGAEAIFEEERLGYECVDEGCVCASCGVEGMGQGERVGVGAEALTGCAFVLWGAGCHGGVLLWLWVVLDGEGARQYVCLAPGI